MSGSRSATAPSGTPLLEPLRDEAHQLDPAARASLERSLGASFGDVVVHTGAASGTLTKDFGAAAFTVGRHVVFGEGRYDPTSMRGRMLLAHELGHVVEQRRGGGDPDLGEHAPAGTIPARDGHTASIPRTAALAALGQSAAITGTAGVGIAREPEEDERDFADLLMEGLRDTVKRNMGRVEGVAQEGGQIVDTGLWAVGKLDDLQDDITDYVGTELGASKEDIEVAKAMNSLTFDMLRNAAKEAGMVDPDTGAIMVSPQITRGFDWVDNRMDATIFAGMKPEEGFFTEREIGQLEGSILTQVGLAFIGVEEIQIGVKVVSGLGALKAIVDAIEKNPSGFATDRAFWVAVAQAGLNLIGLKSASVGKKILAIAVEIGSGLLAASNEIINVRNAYLMSPGPERDKALKTSIQGLIRALAAAMQQAIMHARTAGRAAPQEQAPSAGKGTPPKATSTVPTEPTSTTAKPAAQASQLGEPVAARPAARVDAHTDAPTTTAKALAKPAGQPKPTTPAMPATQPEVPATKAPTSHPSSAKVTKPAKPAKPAKAKTPARKRSQAKADQANAAPQTQPVGGVEQPPMQVPTSPSTDAKATRATVGARSDTSTATATTSRHIGKQAVRQTGKQAGKGAAGSADTITAEPAVATGAKGKSKAQGKSQAKTQGATTSKAAAGGAGPTISATSAKAATKASAAAAASTRKQGGRGAKAAPGDLTTKTTDLATTSVGKTAAGVSKGAVKSGGRDLAEAATTTAGKQAGQAAGKTRKAAKASAAAGTTDTDTATTTTATAGKQAGKKTGKQAGKGAGTKSEPANTSTPAGQKPEAAAAPPTTAKKPSAGKKGSAAQEPDVTKKGTTPAPATTGPLDQHGLPPGWDYSSNPKGPKRRWRIGDAVNMPDSDGRHPAWGTVRERIWKTKAAGELARRSAGTSQADQRLIPLDPIEELTPAQLKDVQETGKMPKAVGAEVEHARIPQRVGRMLEDAGVPRNEAAIVTKVGDPSNLEPTHKEWHAVGDAMAKKRNPNRNRTLPASLDDRIENPLGRASNEEIAGIVAALRKPGVKLDSPAGQKIRAVLAAWKQRHPSAGWEVP